MKTVIHTRFILNQKSIWRHKELDEIFSTIDNESKQILINRFLPEYNDTGHYYQTCAYFPRYNDIEPQYTRDNKYHFILDTMLRDKFPHLKYGTSYFRPFFISRIGRSDVVYPVSKVLTCHKDTSVDEMVEMTKNSLLEVKLIKESPEIYCDWLQDNGFDNIAEILC